MLWIACFLRVSFIVKHIFVSTNFKQIFTYIIYKTKQNKRNSNKNKIIEDKRNDDHNNNPAGMQSPKHYSYFEI